MKNKDEEWVVIATFEQATKAHIIKGMLESEGIYCVITNDHLVSIMPFWRNKTTSEC